MSVPIGEPLELPEYLTWEELEKLPEEIASHVELWGGRVVWLRRGPGEHQTALRRLTNAVERCAGDDMAGRPERCWRANLETNVFFGLTGKSDFLTPDFLVYRCLSPGAEVRAADTMLVGEVLSPANTPHNIEGKKARYARGGIPWYWEVDLRSDLQGIDVIRVYGLDVGHAELPEGVRPLRPANYLLAGEWTPADADGVAFAYPFPLSISWADLAF